MRVIRRFKPQVVVSVFPGVPHRNHGQHQEAGVVAYAAFPVAGDPAALPGLAAEGLAPWTPQALYCCTYFGGDRATVTTSISAIDPWTGKSIYQLAAASRSTASMSTASAAVPPGTMSASNARARMPATAARSPRLS